MNLISLGQLIDDTVCIIILSDNLCVIQDRISRMSIRVSERKNRIFLYRPLELSSLFVGSIQVWF